MIAKRVCVSSLFPPSILKNKSYLYIYRPFEFAIMYVVHAAVLQVYNTQSGGSKNHLDSVMPRMHRVSGSIDRQAAFGLCNGRGAAWATLQASTVIGRHTLCFQLQFPI